MTPLNDPQASNPTPKSSLETPPYLLDPTDFEHLNDSLSLKIARWLHLPDFMTYFIGSPYIPGLNRSETRASFGYITRKLRRDRLLSRTSPYIQPQYALNWLIDVWLPRVFSIENRRLCVILCFISGGIGIPLLLHLLINVLEPPAAHSVFEQLGINDEWYLSPLQLMLIGLVTSAVLLMIYGVWYATKKRDQYVITEFASYSSLPGDEGQIKKIAATTRRMLIKELQSVGALVQHKQIENVHFVREDANAFFMTSGFEGELFDQIQQIVTIEVGNTTGAVDIGRFTMLMARLLARIRITGGVQRHDNGAIEIFIEMRYRNQLSPTVSLTVDPPVEGEDFDDAIIAVRIREAALKLLISLGQVPGVGENWHTLEQFLNGLQASSKNDWWLAIWHYYQALEADNEIEAQKLGVIYYHLGAALVYQGQWAQGRVMLQKAEAYGPQMPETQYMLALTLLYLHWGTLDKSPVIFDEIQHRCQRAIQMRKHFPEAHHLLGIAYYRRGRIEDRARNDSQIEPHEVTRKNYKMAASSYRKALRGYDRVLGKTRKQVSALGLESHEMASLTHQ